MENEFIAQYRTSYQISPDDFNVINPCLKITESTTVKEIIDWYKKDMRDQPMEVKIIQIN